MIPREELLAHAGFVNRLARSLIRDEHQAADVTQQTWLTVLENPPAPAVPVRPWLYRVVWNLTRQMRRAEARRRHHENRASSSTTEHDPESARHREESIRMMTDAVLSLAESYRSTLVLRFYENLTVPDIARRLHVPAGTVKSRLRRGLEQLRRRLDHAHRGERARWMRGLAPLAGASSSVAGSTVPCGSAPSTAIGTSLSCLLVKSGLVALLAVCVVVPMVVVLDLWPFVASPDTRPMIEAGRPGTAPVPARAPDDIVASVVPSALPASRSEPPVTAPETEGPGGAAAGSAVAPARPDPSCGLAWTLAGLEPQTTVRLRLLAAADPRAEWQDTPLLEYFQGLKAQAGWLDPAVDRNVPGQPAPEGALRFEVGHLPPGRYLIWLASRNHGELVTHIRLDPGRQTDLGAIRLQSRTVTVTVTDRATGSPIAGAQVRCVHGVFPLGPARTTDTRGKFTWTTFGGTGVRVDHAGHVPAVAHLRTDQVTVPLDLARPTVLPARPSTWVFVSVGRATLFRVAGGTGQVELPLPESGRPPLALFFDPGTAQWHGGLLQDRRLPSGPCSLHVEVRCGERTLPAGSVSLMHREGQTRILLLSGVKDGLAEFANIPALQYTVEIRCGPQIHDNDHTYRLPQLTVTPDRKTFPVKLPDRTLTVQILDGTGSPLAFEEATYRIRGRDGRQDLAYKISCIARTDARGRVTFSTLPPGQGQLRVRGRTFPLAPSSKVQIVRL